MASNSFVENVNNLANATALAAGDIVEDTQTARDIAVSSASNALVYSQNAEVSKNLAKDWAEKGHNNPVIGTAGLDAEYSSYHWSVESETNSIAGRLMVVNDNIISTSYTWSSDKITTSLATKSDGSHNHDGTYEPVFSKNTAFNKNFVTASGENGSVEIVARSDHNHSSLYEPKRLTQGTAYNKDFGTS